MRFSTAKLQSTEATGIERWK